MLTALQYISETSSLQREASFAAEKQTIWRIYGFKKNCKVLALLILMMMAASFRAAAPFAGAPADLTDALVAAQGYYYE